MKKLCNFICCSLDSDEEQIIEEKRVSVNKKEEKTAMELYGNFPALNYMLVRMTQKNFFVDFQMRKSKLVDKNPFLVYMSYVENGVKIEQEEHRYLMPEKVSQYIGRRMREVKPTLIVDGLARSGINSIQFSSETYTQVLGHNFSSTFNKNAVHNISICQLPTKCDFIQACLPSLPIIQSDILFIQPDYELVDEKVTQIYPSIENILKFSVQRSKNLIIVFPTQIDLHQICEVFCLNLKIMKQETLIIEVQKIQIDGELYFYVFYMGEIAATQTQDEYSVMAEMTLEDSQQSNLYDSTYMLLKNVGFTISNRELMDILLYARQISQSETTLQSLINQLLIKGYTNELTIQSLFGQEDYLPSSTPKYNPIEEGHNTFGQIPLPNEKQDTPGMKKKKKAQFISFNNPYD